MCIAHLIYLLFSYLSPVIFESPYCQRKSPLWPFQYLMSLVHKKKQGEGVKFSDIEEAANLKDTDDDEEAAEKVEEDVQEEINRCKNEEVCRNAAVIVSNVSKTFGSKVGREVVRALRHVTLHVEKGEFFGLLGPNGAGKTTLIRILTGVDKVTSGYAAVAGHDIVSERSLAQMNIGYCPQFDILDPDLTALEQLLFYVRLKGCPIKYEKMFAEKILSEVCLTNERRRLSNKLSGGQKRRLSLAIALSGNPSVIFLDEPSTGLDPGTTKELWKILSAVKVKKKKAFKLLLINFMLLCLCVD